MKYVLDINVAFKWRVPEADSDKAIRLLDEYRQNLHDLFAPDFFPIELAHALTKAERRTPVPIIKPGEAKLFWLDAMTTPPIFLPSLHHAQRAIEIASQAKIGVYDCVSSPWRRLLDAKCSPRTRN